jgi:hypothetical protein
MSSAVHARVAAEEDCMDNIIPINALMILHRELTCPFASDSVSNAFPEPLLLFLADPAEGGSSSVPRDIDV